MESGGLAGAIGRRAEAIYAELDDDTRSAAREVFLRLVSVDEEHEDTRRRVRRTELEHSGVGADVLDAVLREYGRSPAAHVRPRCRHQDTDGRGRP